MSRIPAGLQVNNVKFLPIVNPFIRAIGIPQQFEPQATWISIMIVDTWSGRSPLYHLSRLAETLNLDLFFDDSFSAEGFNDDAAGRFLDLVYQTGSMGLFTSSALPAGDVFALD
jgi:hypothetical protein